MPDDVFRRPGDWTPISRAEAASQKHWEPVVVVSRTITGDRAAWFDEHSTFSRGAGPHGLRDLRYYRYVGTVRSLAGVLRARSTPATEPEAVEETAAAPLAQAATEKTWVEVQLVDDAGKPVTGEQCVVELPDGSIKEGTLDAQGVARFDGIDPGTCKISFPNLDGRDWKKS